MLACLMSNLKCKFVTVLGRHLTFFFDNVEQEKYELVKKNCAQQKCQSWLGNC